jgi:hypothetical protein
MHLLHYQILLSERTQTSCLYFLSGLYTRLFLESQTETNIQKIFFLFQIYQYNFLESKNCKFKLKMYTNIYIYRKCTHKYNPMLRILCKIFPRSYQDRARSLRPDILKDFTKILSRTCLI